MGGFEAASLISGVEVGNLNPRNLVWNLYDPLRRRGEAEGGVENSGKTDREGNDSIGTRVANQ